MTDKDKSTSAENVDHEKQITDLDQDFDIKRQEQQRQRGPGLVAILWVILLMLLGLLWLLLLWRTLFH